MATQLRAVVDNPPSAAAETIEFLDHLADQLHDTFTKAKDISFDFAVPPGKLMGRLRLTMKFDRREDREGAMFMLTNGMAVPSVNFTNIQPGVEAGARRRLILTAEIV